MYIDSNTTWCMRAVQEGAPGPLVLSPAPLFLGDRFLGDAVWRRLRPDGMLVINALGPEKHLTAVEEALTRCAYAIGCIFAALACASLHRIETLHLLPSLPSLPVA